MNPRKLFFSRVGLGAAVALTLIIAACGAAVSTPTSTPEPTPTPTPTATVAPTVTPTLPPTVPALQAPAPDPASTPTMVPTPTLEPTPTPVEKTIPQIIKELTPSVVHVQTEALQLDQFNQPVPTMGVGTGEIIDESGHVLTNNHVIDGAEKIVVTLSDGRAFEAKLVGRDALLDLAVLRIEADNLVPISIGESSKLQVGDQVTAIGHALNLPGGPTVTGGWVSALNRSVDFSETISMQHLIQTDAAINPGNSGGPLVNLRWELVGINTAKIPTGEGIGFAIAIDPVRP